ncbi:MAG: hypothetical protein IJ209_05900 [Bacteroidaceae bacterium]|nr:hypothetical protein [Bacteroidaceae bacterium]
MRLFFRYLCVGLLLAGLTSGVGAQEAAPIRKATRQSVITGAKNMEVRTRQATFYYLVSTDTPQLLHLAPGTINIGGTDFARTDITSIRFRTLPHEFLDEDNVAYDKTATFDHAALALRRTFNLGRWNSLVLPFDLTGKQLRYAFGDDAELAQPRAITDEGQVTLEFATLDLATDDIVLRAGYHYLLRPTREPDIEATARMRNFVDDRPFGPIYFIPDVTKAANQTPRLQTVQNTDGSVKVRFHGTYNLLDGSDVSGRTVKNKRVAPGMYYLNSEGLMEFSEDSLTLQAFRSWIDDVSADRPPLRFYVDGIGEDITVTPDAIRSIPEALGLTNADDATSAGIFTLSGQRLGDATPERRATLRKGIYIINGHKVAIK